MHLFDLIKKYRSQVSFSIFLIVIENLAWIVEPYLLGKVIDALIDKEFTNPATDTILPISIWVILFAVNTLAGAYRRIYDTKLFTKLFTKLATYVAENSLQKNLSTSLTSARAELSYQYIYFLQYRMPEIIDNLISIFGAIVAMYLFDWRISLTCLVIVVPLYFINKFYVSKVSPYQKEYHDKYEDVVEVISKKDPAQVEKYYQDLARPQIRISKWNALNFSLVRIVLLIIFLSVLFIAIDLDGFSAGELFSIVAYLWTFVTSSEYLPELMESWSSLKDISERLKKV
ncbi:MAG: ABC transporter six-transmembrane domain-containing protein [bacterium]